MEALETQAQATQEKRKCCDKAECVLLFIWAGSNYKITICLRSGNKAVVYSNRKKIATAFVEDIKERAKI